MRKLLKEKLIKLQSDIKKEYEEIQEIFMNSTISSSTQGSINKWKREKEYLKKHNFSDFSEAIDYAVELELSHQELTTILNR